MYNKAIVEDVKRSLQEISTKEEAIKYLEREFEKGLSKKVHFDRERVKCDNSQIIVKGKEFNIMYRTRVSKSEIIRLQKYNLDTFELLKQKDFDLKMHRNRFTFKDEKNGWFYYTFDLESSLNMIVYRVDLEFERTQVSEFNSLKRETYIDQNLCFCQTFLQQYVSKLIIRDNRVFKVRNKMPSKKLSYTVFGSHKKHAYLQFKEKRNIYGVKILQHRSMKFLVTCRKKRNMTYTKYEFFTLRNWPYILYLKTNKDYMEDDFYLDSSEGRDLYHDVFLFSVVERKEWKVSRDLFGKNDRIRDLGHTVIIYSLSGYYYLDLDAKVLKKIKYEKFPTFKPLWLDDEQKYLYEFDNNNLKKVDLKTDEVCQMNYDMNRRACNKLINYKDDLVYFYQRNRICYFLKNTLVFDRDLEGDKSILMVDKANVIMTNDDIVSQIFKENGEIFTQKMIFKQKMHFIGEISKNGLILLHDNFGYLYRIDYKHQNGIKIVERKYMGEILEEGLDYDKDHITHLENRKIYHFNWIPEINRIVRYNTRKKLNTFFIYDKNDLNTAVLTWELNYEDLTAYSYSEYYKKICMIKERKNSDKYMVIIDHENEKIKEKGLNIPAFLNLFHFIKQVKNRSFAETKQKPELISFKVRNKNAGEYFVILYDLDKDRISYVLEMITDVKYDFRGEQNRVFHHKKETIIIQLFVNKSLIPQKIKDNIIEAKRRKEENIKKKHLEERRNQMNDRIIMDEIPNRYEMARDLRNNFSLPNYNPGEYQTLNMEGNDWLGQNVLIPAVDDDNIVIDEEDDGPGKFLICLILRKLGIGK